jgi:small multidrug resistance pump
MTRVTIYLCLAGSILAEVVATIALAESESLTKPIPGVISVVCFVAAFWLLSFPLRTMPAGIVYAVWSGLAIVLITAAASVWSKQALDVPVLIGIVLITVGVIVMNVLEIRAPLTRAVFSGTRKAARGDREKHARTSRFGADRICPWCVRQPEMPAREGLAQRVRTAGLARSLAAACYLAFSASFSRHFSFPTAASAS